MTKLDFDDTQFDFETVLRVRSTEVDAGQYLTIDALVSMLSEVRARFWYAKGITLAAEHQKLRITEMCLNLLATVRIREELLFEVGVHSLHAQGGVLSVQASRMHDGSMVCLAQFDFVCFDHRLGATMDLSEDSAERLRP